MRPLNILLALALFAAVDSRAEVSVATEPFGVSIQREPVNFQDPMYRAFITAGGEKFTFIVPEGFSASGDPTHGRLTFKTLTGDKCITLAFVNGASPDARTLPPEPYRALVVERHPGGKIVKEFTRPAGGRSGTVFDMEWKTPEGWPQTSRTIYVPTSAGVAEITMTTSTKKFKDSQRLLNSLLGTFAASVNGKLEVRHIGGPT